MSSLYVGTSAFTAAGWEGTFYPEGTNPADFLCVYAQHFNSVEVDSTFYRIQSLSTVKGWYEKTPKGFIFAAKIPQVITHEKVLGDCDADGKVSEKVLRGAANHGFRVPARVLPGSPSLWPRNE